MHREDCPCMIFASSGYGRCEWLPLLGSTVCSSIDGEGIAIEAPKAKHCPRGGGHVVGLLPRHSACFIARVLLRD